MGLLDSLRDAASNTEMDVKAYCPRCGKYTQQVQAGVFGRAHKMVCKRCGNVQTR